MEVTIQGSGDFFKKFNNFKTFLQSGRFRRLLEETKDALLRGARADAPVSKRSTGVVSGGLLKSRIAGRIEGFGTDHIKIIYGIENLQNASGYNYGFAQEFGAAPHFIFP